MYMYVYVCICIVIQPSEIVGVWSMNSDVQEMGVTVPSGVHPP
jgi:hypothetical protein